VGQRSAGIAVGRALGRGLDDVQVVQDIVKGALVWEAFEQGSYCVFRGHDNPTQEGSDPSIRPGETESKLFVRRFSPHVPKRKDDI
jgi:hypothetical protein